MGRMKDHAIDQIDAGTHCAECGAPFVPNGITTGYGTRADGTRICFECCAQSDRADMVRTGRAVLYLSTPNGAPNGPRYDHRYGPRHVPGALFKIGNWPGSLTFNTFGDVRESWHNVGRVRRDFWFIGPDRWIWHGYQIGHRGEIARCARTRAVWCVESQREIRVPRAVTRAELRERLTAHGMAQESIDLVVSVLPNVGANHESKTL